MNIQSLRKGILGCGLALLAITAPSVRGDVAPPVEIRMQVPTSAAAAGHVFDGVFEVEIFRPGTLTDVEISGVGWTILPGADTSNRRVNAPVVIQIPFSAIPTDADRPIGLTLHWNGRRAGDSFVVGSSYFENIGRPRRLRLLAAQSMTAPEASEAAEVSIAGGAIPIRVVGRWTYQRSGRDMTGDGDLNDPEDIQPVVVGVDGMRVRVLDDDDIASETIWSGTTDVNGYFDTGVVQWDDCDVVGCDDPDLVVEFEAFTSVVDVTDNSITEDTYIWSTEEVTDFTGSFYDAGVMTPGDAGLMPALHIFSNITRVHRFILTRTGYNVPHVQVEWPETGAGNAGAFYQSGPEEIHVGPTRQWRDDTHAHEYGHHFMNKFATNVEPDYCNGFCDGEDSCTSGTDCEDSGHCLWCPETDHDAWNEGWPNWLADVATRSYPDDYEFDDGTPFTALYTRSQEGLGNCCQDNSSHQNDALITEGFVGALLRDIEDATQDTHSGGAFVDSLCLGVDEIFQVLVDYNPTTISQFLAFFRLEYPEHAPLLYPTGRNISPDFAQGYPADGTPPGVVQALDSPTHPLGVGGPLPCIVVEWDHAPDTGWGACAYSFTWTPDAPGPMPNDEDDADSYGFNGCRVTTTAGFDLGLYYFNVRARDCAGNWSDSYASFGPFTVTDCNGTGLLDLCDIDCDHAGYPGCSISGGFCNRTGCGGSSDCQPNLAPDECDIADGTSEDCNESEVPDECEVIYHWVDDGTTWDDDASWEEMATPAVGSDVCIDVPGDDTALVSHNTFDIGILACEESLDILSSTIPRPDVTLRDASWIRGDLTFHGSLGTLRVDERLDIDGMFHWTGTNNSQVATLTGAGETHVFGGLEFSGIAPINNHRLILEPGSTSTSTGWFLCPGNSTFTVSAGAVFDHQGVSNAFNQCWFSELINEGSIIRSTPNGNSVYDIPVTNSGLMHVQSGMMTLSRGSTHTGSIIGEPGTEVRFVCGGHDFLPGSTLVADTVHMLGGSCGENFFRGSYNVSEHTWKGTTSPWTFTNEANIISYGTNLTIVGAMVFDATVGSTVNFDTIAIAGGTARFNSGDPIVANVLNFAIGTIFGPSPLTINTSFSWSASSGFVGPGTVTLLGDSTVLPGGGVKSVTNIAMENHGYMTMTGGFQMSGTSEFTNHVDATVDMRVDSGGSVIGGGASIPFYNDGTLLKSLGPGNSNVTSPVTNTGTIEIQVGKIQFQQPFLQTDGETFLNGGGFHVWWSNNNIPPAVFAGGVLRGTGTITANQDVIVHNTGATVTPGAPIGTIEVAGVYTQSASGALEIELGGTDAGQFDTLQVSATATLGGSLNVVQTGGFIGEPGDFFVILTAGDVVGTFDAENVPPGYEVSYSPTTVTVAIPLPGDLDGDYDLDLGDYRMFQLCYTETDLAPSSNCPMGSDADFDADTDVDLDDYAIFYGYFAALP